MKIAFPHIHLDFSAVHFSWPQSVYHFISARNASGCLLFSSTTCLML